MSLDRSRWWVRWILAPVLLAVVVHASRTLYLNRQFDARVQALRDAGAPIRFVELAPPPVPDDRNAAPLLAEADAWYQEHLQADEGLIPENGELDPEQGAALRAWLARGDPYVELLERAAARPYLRQDLDWSAGPAMIVVQTGPQLQRAITFLAQRARRADRATPEILRELATSLDLATKAERFCVLYVLVRWTVEEVAADALEVLSHKPGFDAGTAREVLDARFAASEDAPLLVDALRGERAMALDFARRWIDGESPTRMLREFDGGPEPETGVGNWIADFPLGSWLFRPFAYRDALGVMDLMDRAIALPDLSPRDAYSAAGALQDEYRRSFPNLTSHLIAVTPTRAMKARLRHLACMHVTRVALAVLERREASGAWPERLDDVVEYRARAKTEQFAAALTSSGDTPAAPEPAPTAAALAS